MNRQHEQLQQQASMKQLKRALAEKDYDKADELARELAKRD